MLVQEKGAPLLGNLNYLGILVLQLVASLCTVHIYGSLLHPSTAHHTWIA